MATVSCADRQQVQRTAALTVVTWLCECSCSQAGGLDVESHKIIQRVWKTSYMQISYDI